MPAVRSTPDSLLYGHARNAYLQIIVGGYLDADVMADLVVGELPTGTGGDERTESNVLLGMADWPARAGSESLGLRKIVEPVQQERDSFAIVGAGDLNNDGRDDLITVALTQAGRPNQSLKLGVHWSPEKWPRSPNLTRPDVSFEIGSNVTPHAARAADLNGDRKNDLILTGESGVEIVMGRDPWPSRLTLEPPDVKIGPGPASVSIADADDDGVPDLWVTFDAPGVDVALFTGRPSWPSELDGTADADWRMGTGGRDFGGAVVPDLSADSVADVLKINNASGSFQVFHGGADVVARLSSGKQDWSVTGVTDTWAVEVMDMTGDSVAEILVNRRAVISGRDGRVGTYDIASGDHDADWPGLGPGTLWSADVDGREGDDVLVSDSSASVGGRNNAGAISVFFSPLYEPGTPVSPTASATPTTVGGTTTSTPTPSVDATTTHTMTPGTGQSSVWLPVAWATD